MAETIRFDSLRTRDAVLHALFPERTCMDMPGYYELSDGRQLHVFNLKITIYGKDES